MSGILGQVEVRRVLTLERVEVRGVSEIEFPKDKDILGMLRYLCDGVLWEAVVTQDTDGDGNPCFRLWYRQGNRYQRSGKFLEGSILVDHIRRAAHRKFDIDPVLDTLDKLKSKRAFSAVPQCFNNPSMQPELESKCGLCPYRGECRAVVGFPVVGLNSVVINPEFKGTNSSEPDDVLMNRVRRKVVDRWGEDK